MSANMIYTNHMKDIQAYLSGKLPEVPEHVVMEISAHISNRTICLVHDMIRDYERENKARELRRAKEYESHIRKVVLDNAL